MPRPWTVLQTRYLLERWWLKLREDKVRLPSGVVLDEYHVLEYPDWACIVCLDQAGRLVMVRQYRHAIADTILELPAGAIDAGEDPLATAQRELLEETGYTAATWTYLGHCAPDPSRHAHDAHLFVARGAQQTAAPALDASEDLAVETHPVAEVLALADRGALRHGIHLTALFWAERRGLLQPV